jgi:hypothetical protein
MQLKVEEDGFVERLISNEATFHISGKVNRHNVHNVHNVHTHTHTHTHTHNCMTSQRIKYQETSRLLLLKENDISKAAYSDEQIACHINQQRPGVLSSTHVQ